MRRTINGFTIVELLIVIVVIAILAAISVAAYTGIQNRANDSAVQNDLTNFAKKLQLAAADTGEFPVGGANQFGSGSGDVTGNSANLPGFTFLPSKSAYHAQYENLLYCTGVDTSSGQKIFRIRARSKSGNTFTYTSNTGMQNVGNIAAGWEPQVCTGMNFPRTWSYGYYATGSVWRGWAGG